MPLTLSVPDSQALKEHYMDFIQNGGFFIPSSGLFKMGAVVDIALNCEFADQNLVFSGKIVWLSSSNTPQGQGIGVQFIGEEGEVARLTIEKLIDFTPPVN